MARPSGRLNGEPKKIKNHCRRNIFDDLTDKKMKQDNTPTQVGKRYVPYGQNGVYYVYDNEQMCVPMNADYGTKKKVQSICDKMNTEFSQPTQVGNEVLPGDIFYECNGLHPDFYVASDVREGYVYTAPLSFRFRVRDCKVVRPKNGAVNNYNKLVEDNEKLEKLCKQLLKEKLEHGWVSYKNLVESNRELLAALEKSYAFHIEHKKHLSNLHLFDELKTAINNAKNL